MTAVCDLGILFCCHNLLGPTFIEWVKLQQEKTMAHLKPAWLATHAVAFVEDQCACKCPVNKALCASEHKALFDEASCSCQCDVAARQRCEADAGNFEPGMMVWKEQGCRCECKLTAKMCRDRPVAPGGDAKVLDTTPRACGCKCPDGLGSQKALCDMKMALPQSGGMFRWNEDTCQCECARKPEGGKHGVCGKEQCTPGQIKKMELSTCKVWDEDTCGCVEIKDAVCPTNVHRGCDWLFRILKNGKDKLAATFQAGTDDIVRYPAHAVCDVLIDSSMSSKGFREHAPPWLLAQIGSNLPKTEDNKDRNLGTHCRSACANRFNLLHSNKGMFQVSKGNIAMKDVSMNEKSCHVWTWKDLQCTGPAPLGDPSGDPTCQTSKFRERMEALFHPDPYAPKPSETEKAWVAHVRSRELRQSADHKRCGRSQCETMEPPTGLFVLAMDVAWPEQDAEARKIKADRNNDRSGMGTPTTGTRKKKKTGKL